MKHLPFAHACLLLIGFASLGHAADIQVTENDDLIKIETSQLEAAIKKRGYVTGVAAQSFLDKQTGFRDAGFGRTRDSPLKQ